MKRTKSWKYNKSKLDDYLDDSHYLVQTPQYVAPKETGFKIDCGHVSACSLAPSAVIHVPQALWNSLIDLCGQFRTEWLGLLTGEIAGGEARLDGVYFPPQTASAVSVCNITELTEVQPRTVGCIHSHVNMAAHWSNTDTEHANWPIEVVLNSKGEYAATVLLTLACGNAMRKDATVTLVQPCLTSYLSGRIAEAIDVGTKHEAAKSPPPVSVVSAIQYPFQGRIWSPEEHTWIDIHTGHFLCPVCYEPAPCASHPSAA